MTAGNKLSRIIAVFLCAFITLGIVSFVSPRNEVQASGTAKLTQHDTHGDECNFSISLSGVKKGAKVTIRLDAPHEIGGYSISSPKGASVSRVKGTEQAILISFTYRGKAVKGQVTGTNVAEGTFKAKIAKILAPKTKKKAAKATKATEEKKKSATKKSPASKKMLTQSSETTVISETTENKVLLAAPDTVEETIPSEPEDSSNAVLAHDNPVKNQRSFAWLWVVLLAIIAGLSFLRVRKLRNDGKRGKDLLLDFIPGVGDLVYAYSGSSKKYAPIASDAQHGYSYNPAVGKKEIKQIDEEAAKEEQSPFKPAEAHEPIKRPKEFSVNHAAAVAAKNSSDETSSAAASAAPVLSAGIAPKSERKAASPFKKLDGATRPDAVDPNAVFKTEVSHTTDDIMTSAFKPASSSHTTEKIVTSAFKPAGGSHSSEKIVTSAVKQTSKFTPQGGTAARKTVNSADSESIRLARERAEAAREQQAMRAAMRTGKTVAEIKGEAKPVQTGPVNRPSAFGTNRPAENASNAKPEFNPTVVPARTKAATSNSNQLGSMLSGRSNNAAARTPVWATPSASINPFQQSSDAKEEVKDQAPDTTVQEEAPVQISYADQAVSHKSAFFSRAASKEGREDTVYSTSSYGSILPPTAALAEDKHVKDTRYKQSKGSLLEGQKPAIANPDQHVAPTATQPVFGFKPVDPQ